jgi:hypothetical protein
MAKTTREVERERKLLALADEWDQTRERPGSSAPGGYAVVAWGRGLISP